MTCRSCGGDIAQGSRFCPRCGRSNEGAGPVATAASAPALPRIEPSISPPLSVGSESGFQALSTFGPRSSLLATFSWGNLTWGDIAVSAGLILIAFSIFLPWFDYGGILSVAGTTHVWLYLTWLIAAAAAAYAVLVKGRGAKLGSLSDLAAQRVLIGIDFEPSSRPNQWSNRGEPVGRRVLCAGTRGSGRGQPRPI